MMEGKGTIRPVGTVFIVLCCLFNSHVLAFIATCGILVALYVWHIPRNESHSKEVLNNVIHCPIIAHRGAGFDAPENTIEAFRLAKQNGAQAVEFDVDYTSDGVGVLLHDSTVDRTTDGSGYINNMTFQDLQKLNAATSHPDRQEFTGVRVPTLDEGVKVCLELGLFMYIDVKSNATKTSEYIANLYKKYPALYKRAAVCSFHPDIVYKVRKCDPDIVTGLAHRPSVMAREYDGSWRAYLPTWKRHLLDIMDPVLTWAHFHVLYYLCGTSLFLAGNQHLNRWTVKHFHDRGIQIVVWTINEPKEKAFLSDVLHVPYMTDTLLPSCGS